MFKSARIKLTLWYLAILLVITSGFSVAAYKGIDLITDKALQNHQLRIAARIQEYRGLGVIPIPRSIFEDIEAIKEVRKNTARTLFTINGIVLLTAGFLAYFLAGKTLAPIEESANKQKGFISDAAHELKTPLASIKTQIEVAMRQKKLSENESRNLLGEVLEEVDALTVLVSSLLKQNRYESVVISSMAEPYKLMEVVTEAIAKVKRKADAKEVSITIEDVGEIELEGAREGIKELLTILIDNAVKFSRKGQKVLINIVDTGNSVVIKVEDAGVGISPEDLPHIFERFYKSDKSRTKIDTEGYGLGLSIAMEIVNSHKGTLVVESEPDKGSTFVVELPKKFSA